MLGMIGKRMLVLKQWKSDVLSRSWPSYRRVALRALCGKRVIRVDC